MVDRWWLEAVGQKAQGTAHLVGVEVEGALVDLEGKEAGAALGAWEERSFVICKADQYSNVRWI